MTEANGQEMPIRWVVLFTGTTLTADYEPTGSAGESPELVREVSNLCVAFHPHRKSASFHRIVECIFTGGRVPPAIMCDSCFHRAEPGWRTNLTGVRQPAV
jgi:hypothetical protein